MASFKYKDTLRGHILFAIFYVTTPFRLPKSRFAAWQTQFAISFAEKKARCDRIIHGYHAISKCIMHAEER